MPQFIRAHCTTVCDCWGKEISAIHSRQPVCSATSQGAVLAINLKGFTMGAACVHDRTCIGLRQRLLLTAACGLGILALGYPASAQTIGLNQTVNVSSLGSGATPNFQGGTLVVDKTGSYANNFVLGTATTTQIANMIDAHGNQGTFSGIGSDAQ